MRSFIESTPSGLNVEDMFGYATNGNNFPGVLAIVFKGKTSIAGFTISKLLSLLTIAWPELVSVTGAAALFQVHTNPVLTSASAPKCEKISLGLGVFNNAALNTVDFPRLVTIGANLDLTNNPALSSVNLTSYLPTNGRNQNLAGCALSQASVDHMLARCVANPAYVSGSVNTGGGTSAPPSAAGLVDKAILTARGVSVGTN